jgi:hypothetical protein
MLVFPPVAQKASAGLTEYPLILSLILVLAATLPQELSPAAYVLLDQLDNAAVMAQSANLLGDRAAEASRLSKASGAAEALMGITKACSDCDAVRTTLQQIIGPLALLRTIAVGASGSCHTNVLLQPHEQCDPLAIPTGCPVTTELTYCSDECRCVPVP